MTKPLLYLATPYSKYPGGLDHAFMGAVQLMFRLRNKGHRVYSPIAASHMLAKQTGIDPRDHSFWMECCGPWLWKCDVLVVAQMPGWRESEGVGIEVNLFKETRRPIRYLDCESLNLSEVPA